jgi:hypothetical protein
MGTRLIFSRKKTNQSTILWWYQKISIFCVPAFAFLRLLSFYPGVSVFDLMTALMMTRRAAGAAAMNDEWPHSFPPIQHGCC